jgi:hypothetical protein
LVKKANAITFLTCVIYKKARVFFPGRSFQPDVMFASKARAYPSGAYFRYATIG